MELLPDDVRPEGVDRLHVRAVARERRDVRHAAVEVSGAHRVPHGLALPRHRQMVLVVRPRQSHLRLATRHELALLGEDVRRARAAVRGAAPVEEVLGELQVARLAGRAVELAEGELDLLVSGHGLELRRAGAERPVDEVGRTDRDVEKRPLPRDLMVGDGRLVHVADVVELVAEVAVAPPRGPHHAVVRLAVLLPIGEAERAGRVEIAVRLLGLCDQVDQVVQVLLELRVRMRRERVGRTLDDLVDVGVIERDSAERAPVARRRVAEVRDAGVLALAEVGPHRDEAVRLEARQPEPRRHGDVRHLGGAERIVARPAGPPCHQRAQRHQAFAKRTPRVSVFPPARCPRVSPYAQIPFTCFFPRHEFPLSFPFVGCLGPLHFGLP